MSAKFTYPLVIQLISIINRDFPTYLTKFGLTENFNWYDTVQLWPETNPGLLLYETEDALNPNSEHTFQQTIALQCRIQLVHIDRNIVAQNMRGYLGAMTLLMAYYDWQNHASDLVSPVSIPSSLAQLGSKTSGMDANVTRIFVNRLTYDEYGVKDADFMMRATAHLLIQMEEIQ